MDQRAQISIEYILLVAIIFLIVIVFGVIITNQNEQNNVATAAQLGASNATANLSFTNNSQLPVKVTYVNMTNGTNGTNINMVIHFSGPITNSAPIFTGIATSLRSSGYTNITQNSNNVILTTRTGTGLHHIYNITLG
jgi:uncharacterized protein (UPF0333 family)